MITPNPNMSLIDVDKIIKDKNPHLYKWLPETMINYIKKIIHQDEFNTFLLREKNKLNFDFINAALNEFDIKIQSKGTENIPLSGGCILACNHPLGGIDGIAVMSLAGVYRKDLFAFVNDILMNLENIKPLLIPVNKHGKNDIAIIKQINTVFQQESCLIIFPAGLVSRKNNGQIEDSDWKKSFITKAKKHQLKIIPVYIDAKNSSFFYNLTSIRKALGIKINIEMFYLVDETYKQKGKTISINFGKPICYSTFTNEHNDSYWAQKVKNEVYNLQNN